jgi:hypothetical protein
MSVKANSRKLWITKYALTKGIFEDECELSENGHMASSLTRPMQHYHGTEFHGTKAKAIEKALDMRASKIVSLRKQIAKLEALEFQ